MRLFWERGYAATSVADLVEAIGINTPSLYAAFGDKKALFRAAVDRYQSGEGSFALAALRDEPTARAAIRRLLHDAADRFSDPSCPPGCMVVLAGTNCPQEASDIADDLAARRRMVEALLRTRIEAGMALGELRPDADAAELAAFYAAVFQGMSIQARDGASNERLQRVADRAVAAWPGCDDRNQKENA